MKKQGTIILLLIACYFSSHGQQNTMKTDPDLATFELDTLVNQLNSQERPWLPFMKGQNVLTGLYKLPKGAEDRQSPHDTDEVYYVVSGKAKFMAGAKKVEVKAGSILFVKAEVEHRFFDIEEELIMVVFFDQ